MIKLTNVEKSIKEKKVLANINVEFKEGKVYLLKGHNGSGKTMLLRMLCGLINPTSGTIEKKDTYTYGVIIENPAFLNNESAFYNLKFLASINNVIKDQQINEVLKMVGLFENKDQKVKSFSLGMKQRLAICQAIMENPDVLLLDEPFNAIDDKNVEILFNILKKYKQEGKIIVVAAHGLNLNDNQLFDEILTMNDGEITKVDAVGLKGV